MIEVVILAAGSSRRLRRPKQMELVGGETLLERAVRVAREAGVGRVRVVVNAADAAVVAEAGRLGCEVVRNDEAEEGIASTIRAGVRAMTEGAKGVVLMTCDQPAVSTEHLRLLAGGDGEVVVASAYAGRRGVPAYFPARCFAALLELRGDMGARELLRGAHAVELAHGELDVDSDAELGRAREMFGGGGLPSRTWDDQS